MQTMSAAFATCNYASIRTRLSDSKVTSCANVLADACAEEFPYDRLYGESLTVALFVSLLNASNKRTEKRRIGGLAVWH